MRQAGMKRPWAEAWLKEEGAFDRELARLWFDTNVGDSRSLAFLVEVMGTNFAGWDQQTSVKKGADIPGLADNGRRLLGRQPRTALPGARRFWQTFWLTTHWWRKEVSRCRTTRFWNCRSRT